MKLNDIITQLFSYFSGGLVIPSLKLCWGKNELSHATGNMFTFKCISWSDSNDENQIPNIAEGAGVNVPWFGLVLSVGIDTILFYNE